MNRVVFDYSKLKGRIIEKCNSQKAFADRLGITQSTLTSKLRGYTGFSQEEIFLSADILEINLERINQYFFTRKVQ